MNLPKGDTLISRHCYWSSN